jgi:hypothetical protein
VGRLRQGLILAEPVRSSCAARVESGSYRHGPGRAVRIVDPHVLCVIGGYGHAEEGLVGGPASCHHNYVSEERYEGMDLLVTRKGAISAGSGEWGIIPGSMGTASYIVRGLGNAASFNSASRGAGRRRSRNAAKKRFSAGTGRSRPAAWSVGRTPAWWMRSRTRTSRSRRPWSSSKTWCAEA